MLPDIVSVFPKPADLRADRSASIDVARTGAKPDKEGMIWLNNM
jgi:hypothetical protein